MSLSEYLNEYFKKANIFRNDKILLHSNISKLWRDLKKQNFSFELDNIIEHLVEYLGEKGTLILPTFNFDFCKNFPYFAKSTYSQMGAFSEAGRIKAKNNRTWHPVYSFVIFGNIPNKEIEKKNYSAYGKDSIFNWITEADGKIAIIDLPDQKSMTYYHHIEEIQKVNWRFLKSFKGEYTDFNDKKSLIDAKIYVRKIDKKIKTSVGGMEKILWSKDLYKGHKKFSFEGCRSIKVKVLKFEVEKIIKENKALGILYENSL